MGEFDSVLVVGAGYDPYRKFFPASRRYVTADITAFKGTDVIGDAHELPFAGEIFDCVFASELVEHLQAPARFIAEARRVLTEHGQLVLTVPFMFHMHGDPHDFSRFTIEGLRSLCAGFSEVNVLGQGNRLHVISDIITTAFSPRPPFFPLRILNHIFRLVPSRSPRQSLSTSPSGFLVIATK